MKTKVRVTEQTQFSNGGYRMLFIEILADDKRKLYNPLEVIGTISFQTDETYKDKENKWYGITLKVEGYPNDWKRFQTIGKIAKLISETSYWSAQPDEILLLLNAEKYLNISGNWVPVTWKGKRMYKVMNGTEYHRDIFAANDIDANKQRDGYISKNSQYSNVHLIPTDIVI